MFFSKQRYVFSTLFLLNVFQSYRQKKGLNIFKLLYYAIHGTDKSHTICIVDIRETDVTFGYWLTSN